ncbi:MAG: hypothetical protein J6C84_10335 [Lachnospiraceae bacterium]|nr:hypothetical protein [Lachnospiraceae bacterium]
MKEGNTRQLKNLADSHIAEQERNRVVVIGMGIMNVILALSYLIEVFKGERGILEYAVVFILTILPTVLTVATFLRRKEAGYIRYISAGFYIVFYAYVMFTTTKLIVFCYIIVLTILMNTYGDLKLSISCCFSGLVIAIITVVKIAMNQTITPALMTEIEVMIACLLLVLLYSVMVTRLVDQIGRSRLENLATEKTHISDLLSTVLEVADAMEHNIRVLTEETGKLEESIADTQNSMDDLAKGANSTAESIQTQQVKTAEIQDHILTLKDVTGQIVAHVNTSEQVVDNSRETMKQLKEQMEYSERSSSRVAKEVKELKIYADQMQSIMTLINNVASETSLLALNASIEAARAGEAGRGFSVVATEISNLANQTSNATDDINVLIESIGNSLAEVVQAVNDMLESNQVQTGCINDAALAFDEIDGVIRRIFRESDQLSEMVETVSRANAMIVATIENVSASTQEITAKAVETLEAANSDKQSVENVLFTVEELKLHANELNKNR